MIKDFEWNYESEYHTEKDVECLLRSMGYKKSQVHREANFCGKMPDFQVFPELKSTSRRHEEFISERNLDVPFLIEHKSEKNKDGIESISKYLNLMIGDHIEEDIRRALKIKSVRNICLDLDLDDFRTLPILCLILCNTSVDKDSKIVRVFNLLRGCSVIKSSKYSYDGFCVKPSNREEASLSIRQFANIFSADNFNLNTILNLRWRNVEE